MPRCHTRDVLLAVTCRGLVAHEVRSVEEAVYRFYTQDIELQMLSVWEVRREVHVADAKEWFHICGWLACPACAEKKKAFHWAGICGIAGPCESTEACVARSQGRGHDAVRGVFVRADPVV